MSVKILLFMALLTSSGCQDSPMVTYQPERDDEADDAADRDGPSPTDPDSSGRQPAGPVPLTRNPTDPTGSGSAGPTSNGSGGLTGFQEITYGQGRYKIEVPNDAGPSKAYGLHVHLHGDGGGGYRDFPNRQVVQDLIGVTVRAPMSGTVQWGRSRGTEHANYLDDLIQNELLRKYNIRTDRIYFSGVSGGAYFLTGHFLPMYAQKYRSGALILCGGMAPQVAFQDAASLKDIRLHYIVTSGERRDIDQSIRQSLSAYRPLYTQAAATNMLSDETVGSGGHCEFDNRSYTSGIQQVIDTKFSTVIKN